LKRRTKVDNGKIMEQTKGVGRRWQRKVRGCAPLGNFYAGANEHKYRNWL